MTRPGKAIVMILCVLSCLSVPQKPCYAANWLFVASSKQTGGMNYIDTDSIQIDKNRSNIKAWIKTTGSDGSEMVALFLFNYKERYYQGLKITVYHPDGKSEMSDRVGKINNITPGSVMELIFNKLLEIKGLK